MPTWMEIYVGTMSADAEPVGGGAKLSPRVTTAQGRLNGPTSLVSQKSGGLIDVTHAMVGKCE